MLLATTRFAGTGGKRKRFNAWATRLITGAGNASVMIARASLFLTLSHKERCYCHWHLHQPQADDLSQLLSIEFGIANASESWKPVAIPRKGLCQDNGLVRVSSS